MESTDEKNNPEFVEKKLSEVDKSVIRDYVIKLFMFPTAIITIVSGVGGYLIGHVMTAKAYHDSYLKAWDSSQTSILAASTNAAAVVAKAEHGKNGK